MSPPSSFATAAPSTPRGSSRSPRLSRHQTPASQRQLPFKSTPTPHRPPPLQMSSSPARSPARAAAPKDRSRVIAASDDETSGSDSDSLPDLATVFKRVSPSKDAGSPTRPPPAKRMALPALVLSPARQKVKFDMGVLVGHARKSEATEELARTARQSGQDNSGDDEDESDGGASLHLQDKLSKGGLKLSNKVGRAMERTEVKGAGRSAQAWYFFDPSADVQTLKPRPLPKAAAKGPWKVLASSKKPAESIAAASPWTLTLLKAGTQLPDELFLWILDVAWLGPTNHTRQSCLRIVEQCGEKAAQHLDPDTLQDMFLRLGAAPSIKQLQDPKNSEELEIRSAIKDAYKGRDWAHLRAFLQLLARMAMFLPLKSKLFAAVALMRMGVDTTLMSDVEVLFDRNKALEKLLIALPTKEWDDFCESVAYSIYCAFHPPAFRLASLQRVPLVSRAGTKDLRQRLALCFFLDEPQQAGYRPEEVFSLAAVSRRLDTHPSFAWPDENTDYAALAAAARLLDMAVDDGCADVTGEDEEDRRRFDEEVDALTGRLERFGGSIYDSGLAHALRTEAKGAIEAVLRRLESTVRLKPKPKHGHFVLEGQKADPFRQMDLKRFIKKGGAKMEGIKAGPV